MCKWMMHRLKVTSILRCFGKEHPVYVQGMGFGVCPTMIFESSRNSSFGCASSSEIERLKVELQANNARIQALEEEVAKSPRVRALEEQMTIFMLNLGCQFPRRVNQVRIC